MSRKQIQKRVEAQIVNHEHDGLSQKEISRLIEDISSHWGDDYQHWLPQLGRPQGRPEVWTYGIIVELALIAPLMPGDDRRSAAAAAIGQSRTQRLANANTTTTADIDITPRDTCEVRVKAQLISSITEFWPCEFSQWLPSGVTNCASAFDLTISILCGIALMAQSSSVGSVDRMQEAKAIIAAKIQRRPRSRRCLNAQTVFEALDEGKRAWLNIPYLNTRFYNKLTYMRTSTEKQVQRALNNAARELGSGHGTPEYGVTILQQDQARTGALMTAAYGAYWRIAPSSSSMVPQWTDEKTAANVEVIAQLESIFSQPLAVILKAPKLGTSEALAIPTELLTKIVTLSRQFALSLARLHNLLDAKWQEKHLKRYEAMDNEFPSLKCSDVEEIIQETLKPNPSPLLAADEPPEDLFEKTEKAQEAVPMESALEVGEEAIERENGAVQAEKLEDRPHKRLRLSNNSWSQTLGHEGPAGDGSADNEVDENAAGLDGGSEVTLKGDASPREIVKEREEEPTQAITDTPKSQGASLQVVRSPGEFDGEERNLEIQPPQMDNFDLTIAKELQRQLNYVEKLVLETRKTLRQYEQRREDLERQLKQHEQK
ncbi:uncharacterized protein J3D65DRAFT_664543 [Phyllosticta citribraziliensis]|uniref:Uncharacterized protein n=1 Tax=Phyllosticta citribraziliensis TaxID=989973 RepID=A0ABR1M4R4_9PEZI